MHLTRTSEYAVEALAHMAKAGPDDAFVSHEVARANGIPERFLFVVLKRLVARRLLHSKRGRGGGYGLARPANQITLLEVLEAAGEPLVLPMGRADGGSETVGRLADILDTLAEAARRQLGQVTIADLADWKKGK